MKFLISSCSIPARRRNGAGNQDSYKITDNRLINDAITILISDGMGGLSFPKLASQTAIEISSEYLKNVDHITSDHLSESIVEANKKICVISKEKNCELGATLSILHINKGNFLFSHIGDCRVILFSKNKSQILTKDHTVLAERLDVNNPEIIDIKRNRSFNLTKSLGEHSFTKEYVDTIHQQFNLKRGDVVLLCSDGYYSEISNKRTRFLLRKTNRKIAHMLCRNAYMKDYSDDITVICIKVI